MTRPWVAYALGLALLAAAVAIGVSSLPWRDLWLYGCAILEAALVFGGFIGLQRSSPLVRLFALGTVFWLVILFGVALMDLWRRLHGG